MEKINKWIYRGLVLFTLIYTSLVFYGLYYVCKQDLKRMEIRNKK
jgi:hypothetical protein